MLRSPEERLAWIGHLYFFLFIIMAVTFFRERVLVADAAFQVFDIIRTGDFGLYSNRFSSFIAQALPVAAVHAKLPLNAVLILYSIAPILVCYFCFCLAVYYLKDHKAGLAIVLAGCVLLTEGFYFATFEVNQAVSVLILLFSVLQKGPYFRPGHWLILGLSVLAALFFHPLALIGFVFIWGYVFLQNGPVSRGNLILVLLLGIAVMAVKVLFLTSAYESDKISLLGLYKVLTHLPNFEGPGNFMRWLRQDYYLALVFSAFIVYVLLKQKKKLLAGWYLASVIGFWLLMLLANPNATPSIRYYLELHLQVMALIITLPLVYEVLPPYFKSSWLPLVLGLLLLSRFATMYASRTVFSDRLQWYDKIYAYTEGKAESRFFVEQRNVPGLHSQNQLLWASTYESILYFASQHKPVTKIIHITDDASKLGYLLNEQEKVVTTFEIFPDSILPPHYFKMLPSKYANLNNTSANAGPVPSVSIKPAVAEIQADKGDKIITFPIVLESENLIPSALSGGNAYRLGYKLYKGNREIAANASLNPLEVDIKGAYQQTLTIEVPAEAGEYSIKPYLLPQDQNFWNQPLVKLIVD